MSIKLENMHMNQRIEMPQDYVINQKNSGSWRMKNSKVTTASNNLQKRKSLKLLHPKELQPKPCARAFQKTLTHFTQFKTTSFHPQLKKISICEGDKREALNFVSGTHCFSSTPCYKISEIKMINRKWFIRNWV